MYISYWTSLVHTQMGFYWYRDARILFHWSDTLIHKPLWTVMIGFWYNAGSWREESSTEKMIMIWDMKILVLKYPACIGHRLQRRRGKIGSKISLGLWATKDEGMCQIVLWRSMELPAQKWPAGRTWQFVLLIYFITYNLVKTSGRLCVCHCWWRKQRWQIIQ